MNIAIKVTGLKTVEEKLFLLEIIETGSGNIEENVVVLSSSKNKTLRLLSIPIKKCLYIL